MSHSFRIHRRAALLAAPALALAAILVAAAPPQQAPQQPGATPPSAAPQAPQSPRTGDVTLVLQPGQRPQIHLAFPAVGRPAELAGDADAAGRDLDGTLRADLDFSRGFDILGPDAFSVLTLTGDRAHDFEQYRSLGSEVILVGEIDVEREAQRIVFEGRLYDLKSGQSILAKRYRGAYSAARRIAHTFADEVVQYLLGRRGIALTSIAFASDRSGSKEIWLADYDGADPRQITAHKSTSLSPAWRPDGRALAYTSFVGGPPGLYLANLLTGHKTPIATEGDQNISASYSPDGRRIVFSRALGGNSEIVVADADGGNVSRLTYSRAIDTNPAWSPQGTEIAFTSSRAGNPNIYVMDTDGTNLRRISFAGNYNDGAAWSPEGDAVAYASRQGPAFDVAVTNLATLETTNLTHGEGSNEEPTFSPDGRHIAFTSSRGGGKQVWIVDRDGGNPVRITREGRNESPAWGPYPQE
jgi:TolB protein